MKFEYDENSSAKSKEFRNIKTKCPFKNDINGFGHHDNTKVASAVCCDCTYHNSLDMAKQNVDCEKENKMEKEKLIKYVLGENNE